MSSPNLPMSTDVHFTFDFTDPSIIADKWAEVTLDRHRELNNPDPNVVMEQLNGLTPTIRSQVTTVEFVRATGLRRHDEICRGAWLLDSDGQPVVHVNDALLGGEGVFANLSKHILWLMRADDPDLVKKMSDFIKPIGSGDYGITMQIVQ